MSAWYYAQNGQQHGPVTEEALKMLIARQQLSPDDLVWSEGMADWQPASTVGGMMCPPELPSLHHMTYAGFWKRFAAHLIDGIILAVGGFVAGAMVGMVLGAGMGAAGVGSRTISIVCGAFGYLAGLVLNWLYFTISESSSKQATIGKLALGIRVTDLDGRPISFGRANGRYWSKLISGMTLLFGYLMAGFTQRKQALHDMMAGCVVINK